MDARVNRSAEHGGISEKISERAPRNDQAGQCRESCWPDEPSNWLSASPGVLLISVQHRQLAIPGSQTEEWNKGQHSQDS